MRIGHGFDSHRLVAGRPLRLGGVEVPHDRGLEGHSDGDALLHAVGDALLGAIGQGDLGRHFPSSREDLRDADSRRLLAEIVALVQASGFLVGNLDATLVAEEPRLAEHLAAMEEQLAALLGVTAERVNVKAKSADGLGALGRGEGIAAHAVVLVRESGES